MEEYKHHLRQDEEELLALLREKGEATAKQLAESLFYHASLVTGKLMILRQRGIVEVCGEDPDTELHCVWDIFRVAREYRKLAPKLERFKEHLEKWANCARCPLSAQRKRVVLGSGNLDAPILMIGTSPGKNEEVTGIPFVGTAGKLLRNMLHRYGLLNHVLTNQVGCRNPVELPDGESISGPPETAHVKACLPRLTELLNIVEPRAVVFIGGREDGFLEQFFHKVPSSFPHHWKGVGFYCVRSPENYSPFNPDADYAKRQHLYACTEWQNISEALIRNEEQVPDIRWSLPQNVGC